MADDATVTDLGGDTHAVRYQRRYAQPVDAVWAALTDGAKLGQWFAPGTIELKPGGRVHLAFANSPNVIDSTVTALAPEALLEWHWNAGAVQGGPVRFELAPDGSGSRLTLTHTVPGAMRRPSTLAAWHTHLELLDAALAGKPQAWSNERFMAHRERYARQLG
jgi:uncharacterized protein YndB with AHSA1/START domain